MCQKPQAPWSCTTCAPFSSVSQSWDLNLTSVDLKYAWITWVVRMDNMKFSSQMQCGEEQKKNRNEGKMRESKLELYHPHLLLEWFSLFPTCLCSSFPSFFLHAPFIFFLLFATVLNFIIMIFFHFSFFLSFIFHPSSSSSTLGVKGIVKKERRKMGKGNKNERRGKTNRKDED